MGLLGSLTIVEVYLAVNSSGEDYYIALNKPVRPPSAVEEHRHLKRRSDIS